MQRSLRHRGPDGDGLFIGSFAALAHTRLALLDPAGGAQPMHGADDRYTLVYNGEVYNYLELRDELRPFWEFRTGSDTEVILAAYVVWGEACLLRFNGMFAFFLWDEHKAEGFAARDRLGIKPFAYRHVGGTFQFASEAKALVSIFEQSPRAHVPSILEYLAAPCFSGVEHAMFDEIDYLQAGHALRITRAGMRVWRWWDFDLLGELRRDTECLTEELRERLMQAVSRSLRADVPVGTYLSGGVDSTLLTALASQLKPEPLLTFTVRFTEQDHYDYARSTIVTSDDTPFAQEAAEELGVSSHWVAVERAGLTRDLGQLSAINDALPAWEQEFAQHYLARAASRQRKAVLVGDAADETHYGYHFLLDEEATCSPAGILRRFAQAPIRREWLSDPVRHFEDHYIRLTTAAGHRWHTPLERTLATTYLIVKRWLARLLHNGDIHAMAWSLEARVPFGDADLLDFARQVHPFVGIHERTEKWLLRQACAGIIPEGVRLRKKSALPKDQGVQAEYQVAAARALDESAPFLGAFLELPSLRALCRPERLLHEAERALLFRVMALAHWGRHYAVRVP